jgi:AcrR family transcriptional regulator
VAATPAKPTYHHGALRQALLDACLALIEQEGIGAVSLRRVAREAGVSSGAPYHHFPDRAALLSALSVQGFEELSERARRARAAAGTPQEALSALVEGYVVFAAERRALFQLMMRPELTGPDKQPDVHAAGEAAIGVLTEVIIDCQRAGVAPPGDPATLVALAWSVMHGLASLRLDGPLEHKAAQFGTSPEQLTRDVAALLETLVTGSAAAR